MQTSLPWLPWLHVNLTNVTILTSSFSSTVLVIIGLFSVLVAFDNQPPSRSAFYPLAQTLLSLQCYCPDCDVVNVSTTMGSLGTD